jgi:hypothetical protein
VIAAAFVAACGASPTAPDISFRLIGHGGLATEMRPRESSVVVIRDSALWSDFIQRSGFLAPSGHPEDPIPSISFSSEMAIAILLGSRPTNGYGIRVDRIAQRGAMLIVSATEVVSCGVLPVVTYPLTAIAVPRTDRSIAVEWSRESTCQ